MYTCQQRSPSKCKPRSATTLVGALHACAPTLGQRHIPNGMDKPICGLLLTPPSPAFSPLLPSTSCTPSCSSQRSPVAVSLCTLDHLLPLLGPSSLLHLLPHCHLPPATPNHTTSHVDATCKHCGRSIKPKNQTPSTMDKSSLKGHPWKEIIHLKMECCKNT